MNKKVLGYECKTPGCDIVSQKLLDVCPKCGKKDWRAIVTYEPNSAPCSNDLDSILDDWGYIREECLPFESEFRIKSPGKRNEKIEIVGSSSSLQKDGSGRVQRIRIIDRKNDKYIERVAYLDSGEIIRDCDEKLSEHLGHGNDKK